MTEIMENQQPLENIPGDDHLDSSDEGSHTHTLGIFSLFLLSNFYFFLFLSSDVKQFSLMCIYLIIYELLLFQGESQKDKTEELQGNLPSTS